MLYRDLGRLGIDVKILQDSCEGQNLITLSSRDQHALVAVDALERGQESSQVLSHPKAALRIVWVEGDPVFAAHADMRQPLGHQVEVEAEASEDAVDLLEARDPVLGPEMTNLGLGSNQ